MPQADLEFEKEKERLAFSLTDPAEGVAGVPEFDSP
jgi:hypothetical protein